MADGSPTSQYALGSTDAEHERLIRQAQWVNPYTERCFREAGIRAGYRVLDLGSGVGDVALLLGELVGPTGEVIGVERDPRSVARARRRVAAAGLRNVNFLECDVSQVPDDKPFDAAVGRYILCFLPNPASVLNSLSRLVRPTGVFAFQEPFWASFLEQSQPYALWSIGASLLEETFRRSGANIEIGSQLSHVFQEAGLPAPSTRTDMLLGAEQWMPDVLQSLFPQMKQFNLPVESLGDFATLSQRLRAEVATAHAQIPLPSILSAWCQKHGMA
jgi:SAM-dependent methyltransferase